MNGLELVSRNPVETRLEALSFASLTTNPNE